MRGQSDEILQIGSGPANNHRKEMTAVDYDLEKNPYVKEANEVIRVF